MNKVIAANDPLFKNDENKKKTASLMMAVAFREGSLRPGIKGDKDKRGNFTSFCTMQINLPYGQRTEEGWNGEDLAEDFEKCFTVGYRMLRVSVKLCPKHPVAFYAEGRSLAACASTRAQRISNDRMALAGRLVKTVQWPEQEHVFFEPALRALPPPVHFRRMFWPSSG